MSSCGFNMIYGYTESDEISLLFGWEENSFGRKLRKLISILAGEASAKFTLLLGAVAAFDCRISQLPSVDLVVDYYRLAQRRRSPQRPECALLLASSKARERRGGSHGGPQGHVCRW